MTSKKELEQIVESGLRCTKCERNKPTLNRILGVWSIMPCEDCKKRQKNTMVKRNPSMGSSNVCAVFETNTGEKIPVNEKGNIIHSVNEKSYRNRSWKEPTNL